MANLIIKTQMKTVTEIPSHDLQQVQIEREVN